MLNIARAMM